MGIRIHHLRKQFETFTALDDITLDVRQGELLALLGPSGSGKTTLLRIMAGLEHADGGQVLFGDEDATRMSVQSRRVGFVFQHYALFKHMDVFENIAFGLRVRRGNERWAEARIRARVEELLALVQLQGLEQRYPTQLSGGQRQRVALARALAIEPCVLLLDEPFGALDAQVRRDLRRWLRELHERTGLTTVFVTHDQEEALELADRVAILNRGRIEQLDTPAMIYDKPASPFVYSFVGAVNRIPGVLAQGQIQVAGHALPLANAALAAGPVEVYVRPEDLVPDEAGWPATVAWS
ncbi:sulfate ABC transporter ATP-binding protein, partial [Xanthomonas oryzae pv. oryzae]